jgi:F420H(2)-dependent quinone reductase
MRSCMLRKALLVLGGIFALLLLCGIALYAASESGEIVVLQTRDPATGGVRKTRLWVVDHEGSLWLRAGDPTSSWFRRLQAQPDVTVTRGSEAFAMRAVPTPEARDTINDLMNQKYGWADNLICFFLPRDKKVPVRLLPIIPNWSGR